MSIQNPDQPKKKVSADDKEVLPENKLTEDTTKLNPNNVKKQVVSAVYIDKAGYIQNAGFTKNTISALEHGPIKGPHAIVLHRTDSPNVTSPLASFKKKGVGTHFIVDKDGTVSQTASLLKYTYHIGKIKSRCYENKSCPVDETKKIAGWGWNPTKVYHHEQEKDYPSRYPLNTDSVGIEVVAEHKAKGWEDATEAQLKSINKIIKVLKKKYDLKDNDIYEHDKISYKAAGEGADLYDSNNTYDN